MNVHSNLLLATVAMLAAGSALAEERTISVQDATVVQGEGGVARVFFRLGEIPFSESTLIQRAVLRVPQSGSPAEGTTELCVSPVTDDWSAAVSSNTRYDSSLSEIASIDLRSESGTASFDLTVALKEQLEAGVFADGFVLTCRSEGALAEEALARVGSLSAAELTITTVSLPSGRADRVDRNRAAAHREGRRAP